MNTTPEGIKMQFYTQEEERLIAQSMGATMNVDPGRGGEWHSYSYPWGPRPDDKVHVWCCTRAWAVAVVRGQYYTGHRYFSTLRKALRYASMTARAIRNGRRK